MHTARTPQTDALARGAPVVAALPGVGDVDPVLVGIIAVLLLIVFAFFLLLRRTLLSFSEGVREGRR